MLRPFDPSTLRPFDKAQGKLRSGQAPLRTGLPYMVNADQVDIQAKIGYNGREAEKDSTVPTILQDHSCAAISFWAMFHVGARESR